MARRGSSRSGTRPQLGRKEISFAEKEKFTRLLADKMSVKIGPGWKWFTFERRAMMIKLENWRRLEECSLFPWIIYPAGEIDGNIFPKLWVFFTIFQIDLSILFERRIGTFSLSHLEGWECDNNWESWKENLECDSSTFVRRVMERLTVKKKEKKKEERAPLAGFQQTASLLLPPVTRNRGRL